MNRQNTVDPVSELFERVSKSFKKRELSLLLIVGVIGCIGTMSIFKRSFVKNASSPANLATIKIPEAIDNKIQMSRIDPFLNVNGEFRCSKPLQFQIANYNPKAKYEVHLGDGNIVQVNGDSFNHIYQTDGDYEVALIIHYKKKSNPIFNTRFQILPEVQPFLSSL